MPSLACWSCGRRIFTTVQLDALFPDERRCPRCGALLNQERRGGNRREFNRRENPPDDPGPPEGVERREGDRRGGPRRRPDS
ncbi:MAG TPA: hypothetical protein VIF44_04645 [Candidatus Limnocylindrales bacterium]